MSKWRKLAQIQFPILISIGLNYFSSTLVIRILMIDSPFPKCCSARNYIIIFIFRKLQCSVISTKNLLGNQYQVSKKENSAKMCKLGVALRLRHTL